MDRITSGQRSALMSRIRSKDTEPELRLRRALWAVGLRYRKYDRSLPGRPDIVFRGTRVAVFMDGCFWHGCPECYRAPKSNGKFWREKVDGNRARDKRQTRELRAAGWIVLRFWEHRVNRSLDECVVEVESAVRKND